jgi:hypothetical protein
MRLPAFQNRTIGSIVATCLVVAAMPASALSCLEPTLERSFAEAASSERSYAILYGSIDVDEASLPAEDSKPAPYSVTATFSGQEIQAEGLSENFVHEMVIDVTCSGEWCGGAHDSQDAIFFGRLGENGQLTLESHACSNGVFSEASKEDLDKVIELLNQE